MFDAVFVEGDLEVAVVPALLGACGLSVDPHTIINKRGIQNFWKDVPRLNKAAQHKRIFALADLEQEPCPSDAIASRLGGAPHPQFILRLSVRMTESWLLADAAAMAHYLGIAQKLVPADPEALPNPKQTLVNLARRSRLRHIRDGIAPEPGTSRPVGVDYLPLLSDFARTRWDPDRASASSPSLARALGRLRQYAGA